ncbi:MAG: GNAT family N-acetyltransferase [Bacteroidales bacterium]|nr:GNAT family N-acetyltransferase [Bacteroidales bacterium]
MKSYHTDTINLLTADDFDNLLIIADELFGRGYLNKNELQSYIEDITKTSIVAKINDKIIGFQLMQTSNLDGIMSLVLKEQQWFKEQFSNYSSIGVLKTLAVKDEFKNQGIGTLLTTESIKILRKKSNCILSICWNKNDDTAVSNILGKCGMKQIRKISEFWKEDSLKRNYTCKICGAPPCTCNAIIYKYLTTKDLKQNITQNKPNLKWKKLKV